MRKEKQKLFEDVVINDRAAAEVILADAEASKAKRMKGMKVAAVVEACWLVGYILSKTGVDALIEIGVILFLVGVIGAIAAYIIGGGVLTAIKTGLRVAHVAWFIVPIFPVDLLIYVGALFVCAAGIFVAPLLFVFIEYRQACKDYDFAEAYLNNIKNLII